MDSSPYSCYFWATPYFANTKMPNLQTSITIFIHDEKVNNTQIQYKYTYVYIFGKYCEESVKIR